MIYPFFMISGFVSLLLGITYMTSMDESVGSGFARWGIGLFTWGILVLFITFKQMRTSWIYKGVAVIGILLNGALFFYWVLFLNEVGTRWTRNFFYLVASLYILIICIIMIGTKLKKSVD